MKTARIVGIVFFCVALLTANGFTQSGGLISPVAGNGKAGLSGDGGPATAAQINQPEGIAVDAAGNLYIADTYNHRIRKVTHDGVISTVAGNGTPGYSGDGGPATSAQLNDPAGVALDSAGNLYIAEHYFGHIRKVTPGGVISTIASIYASYKITFDKSGNLYVAQAMGWDNTSRVYRITPAGVTSLVAGGVESEGPPLEGDQATSVCLGQVHGVAIDPSGDLLIASSRGYILKVTPNGKIHIVAGGGTNNPGDGGSALAAQLTPFGLAVDAQGNIYTADWHLTHARIRKVTPDGIIRTIAGKETKGYSGDGGPAVSAEFNNPWDVALDSSGNLYIADRDNQRIRRVENVSPTGITTYFPQIAVGNGWSTLFTFVNTGLLEVSGNLITRDPQGNPLRISGELTDSSGTTRPAQVASSFSFVIPPGGTIFLFATAPDDSMKIGWAQLDSFGSSINAMVTYERTVSANTDSIVSVAQSQPIQLAAIPVDIDNSSGKQLAYAIANPNSRAISINLALIAQDGTVLDGSVSIKLGPGEQIARNLSQDLAFPNLLSEFRGSLVFRSQDGQKFVMFALLGKRGQFSAIPLIAFP